MPLFAVMSIGDSAKEIESAIKENFGPSDFYAAADGSWFIATPLTTSRGLSNKLGITKPHSNEGLDAVVIAVTGYYGLGPAELWEWLAVASTKWS